MISPRDESRPSRKGSGTGPRTLRAYLDTLETAIGDCIARLKARASRLSATIGGSRSARGGLAVRAVDCAALIRRVISGIERPPGRQPVFEVDADVVCSADP